MRPYTPESAIEAEWTDVSVKHPCPICGGHDGCRWRLDDEFACCAQVLSEWPLSVGGWVHRVSGFSLATSQRLGDPSAKTPALVQPSARAGLAGSMDGDGRASAQDGRDPRGLAMWAMVAKITPRETSGVWRTGRK